MPNPENVIGKGKLFSSTYQPKKNGRKPKLYTIAKEAYKISYDEWKNVAMHLMQCSRGEMDEIVNDDDTPVWVLSICKALHRDVVKGSMHATQELASRLWGNTNQSIDVTSNGESIAPKTLSKDEIKEYIKSIEGEY